MSIHIRTAFVSQTEGRLRAFWRLLIQFGLERLVIGGLVKLLTLVSILLLLILLGRIPFSLLNDGPALSEALSAQVAQLPLINAFPDLIAILVVFFVYLLLARFLDRRPFKDFGFHFSAAWWRDLGFGLFLGAALMALIFISELVLGWVHVTGTLENSRMSVPFWNGILIGLVSFFFVGVSEELFARGYLIRNLSEGLNLPRLSPRAAILVAFLLSSLLFGVLHAGNPNATLFSTINLILAGLLFGLSYILTGELAIPIGLHIAWNFTQGYVFGFPVSGVDDGLSLIATQQLGPSVWTGGAFGPEGGLIGVVAILLGMLAVVAWVSRMHGKAAIHTHLAVYVPRLRPAKKTETAGTVLGSARESI